jgi:penicillin-binding protein 2
VAGAALPPLAFKPEHVALINSALYGVTQEGTSTRIFAGAPYKSGGKTGTAQAVGIRANEKYNAAKLGEYQRDHSLYTAFAPLDAPTVALAVIVENAGFGAAAAAPIARRVFDYLLAGQWPNAEDMAATREGRSVAPMGVPRRAEDVTMEEIGLPALVPVASLALPAALAGLAAAPVRQPAPTLPPSPLPAAPAAAPPPPRLALAAAPRRAP